MSMMGIHGGRAKTEYDLESDQFFEEISRLKNLLTASIFRIPSYTLLQSVGVFSC